MSVSWVLTCTRGENPSGIMRKKEFMMKDIEMILHLSDIYAGLYREVFPRVIGHW